MAKESSASRRARVKFQLRDRKGRWIEMGRGVKWYSPRLGREVSGTVVGTKGRNAVVDITSEPKGQDGKPQQVSVKGTDITLIESKASLGGPKPQPPKQAIPTEKAKLSPEEALEKARTDKATSTQARKSKKGGTVEADRDPVADLMKGTGDMLKQADEARAARSPATTPAKTETAPVAKPKAEPKAKTDDKKGSQADSDKEDEKAPEVEEPDVAELEDEDLDLGDLEDDEPADASTEDEGEAGPTSLDDIEATIEELEAVVEEVASGDLDAVEIEEKLAEEVFVLVGNDGKQYDLDVKKDLEGKWNYRLKDAEGKARKIHAMVPVEDNDSVDAGAKLNAVMNPKSKAKATTAKPKAEEKAPEADAVPESERNIDQFKPERVLPKNREDLYSSGADFETKHLTEEDIARLPVGTDIKGVDYDDRLFGQHFTKLADDSWITPHSDMANDGHMVEHGQWTQGIFLPGNEHNDNTPESLAADLDRYGRTWAPNQKDPNARAEDKTPETDPSGSDTKKTVEAPKATTPVPEGEQDELFPKPKSKAPGKNATELKKELDALPDDARIHFSDAMGENSEVYQKVTTNPDEGKPKTLWAKVGVDEKDDDGGLEVLDGSDYKKPGQLEKEREALNSTGIAKKHAGREFETDSVTEPESKGHMAPVNHRPLANTTEAPAESSETKTAKASDDVVAVLKFRMDMEPDNSRGLEIDGENNVTVTDADKAEYIFNAATSDSHAVTNRPNERSSSDIGKELRDELAVLRGKLGVPDNSAKRQQELKERIAADRAPKGEVVDGLEGTALGILKREADLEAGKLPADREDIGFNFDREGNFRVTDRAKAVDTITDLRDGMASNTLSRTAAQDAASLSKALDVLRGDTARSDAAPAPQETESDTPEAKAEPIMAMTIRAGRIKDELWAAIDTQETDGVDPGMRFNGNKLEITDYAKARYAIDGQLAIAHDNANDPESDAMERRNHKSLETGLTKVMTAINDHEEANSSASSDTSGPKGVTKDDLNARSLTQAEDAELTALEDKKVNDLVKGSNDFTPEDADRLKSLDRTSTRRKRGNMVPENDGSTPDSDEGVDEVTALGEKISDSFVAGDADEAHTAQRYLSGQDWNTALRDDTVTPVQAEQIDRLSGFIEKQGALPEGTKVYRGVGSLDFAGDPQVGDTFKEPGFMSTSLRREEAENFASGALIEITPRAGKDKALSISAVRQSADRSNVAGTIDALEGEGEILFPHGTAMRVSAIETDAEGRKVVRVDVVDAPEAEEVNLEAPEAAPERPETAEAPATPETDSDAPAAGTGGTRTAIADWDGQLDAVMDELRVQDKQDSGDRITATIQKLNGLDGKPTVVSDREEFDNLPGTPIFRGVSEEDHAKRFMTGPNWVGEGGNGSGIYTSTYKARGASFERADGGALMEMKISPDAKIVDGHELNNERDADFKKAEAAGDTLGMFLTEGDLGRYASARGLDGYSFTPFDQQTDDEKFVVLTNRSAVSVFGDPEDVDGGPEGDSDTTVETSPDDTTLVSEDADKSVEELAEPLVEGADASTGGTSGTDSTGTKKVTKDDLNDRFLTEAEEDELFALEEDEDLQGRAGDTPELSPERAARKKSLLETQAKRRAGEMVDENTGSSTSSDTTPEPDSDAVAEEEGTAGTDDSADAGIGTPAPAPAVTKTDDELDAEVASRMAELGIERTEPVVLEGEKYPPTRQQQDVIDAVMAGKDTKVQAMAGTGKTSTLEALSRRLEVQGKDAVYIAFNKTVQLEAAERMPKNVEARTGHSLANAWAREAMPFLGIRMANKDPLKTFVDPKTKKTENMPKVPVTASGKIAGVLGIGADSVKVEGGQGLGKSRSVQAVKRMVNSYALSDSDEVGPEHIPAEFSADDAEFVLSEEGKTALVGFAKAYWDDLSREDGVFRVAHDTYRKHWALSRPDLTDGSGGNKGADVLYIDEAQDTPAVLAKVVADQNMQKVIVGDANQAIYEFAENIDYLSQADSDIELPLNKSWRFGPVVADAGNRFLELLEAPNRVVGGGGESKRVVGMEDADAVLVRTNAGMVDAVLEEAENGRRVSAPDGTRDNLKSLATSVQSLMDGERPENPHDDLVGYKNWDEVLTAFYQKDPSVQTLTKLFDVTDAKQLSKMTPDQHQAARESAMARVNKAIDALVEQVDGFKNLKKTVEGKRTYLEVADDFQGTAKQRQFAFLNFAANLGKKKDPYAAAASDSWSVKNKAYRDAGLAALKADGWRYEGSTQRWYSENADTVAKFDAFEGEYDVMVSTAHKSKGLEWDRVRIGYDFPAPRQDENTGVTVMPEDAEYKLAYVAATRAKKELDMGGLDYVYEMTSENGGLPKARKGDSDEADAARVEDGAVTPEAVPEPEDNTDIIASEAEATRYDDSAPAEVADSAAPEAPQAPEPDEVADESVPEAAPETPEATPEPVEAPEPTPAPAATPEPVEAPEESAPEATTPDDATPVDGLDDDGLTPAEAAYAGKLQKAISDGYRTGIGNIQALQERLDEIYDRGAARQRGEDPDAAPEAAPEVKPVVDEEPATPEAEEEVVPEAEEVVEEAPEPTPEAPVEAEAEPVEVVEEPAEEGPQGDASDGEEEIEAPTDLDSFEATASELFTTFQDVQKTPRTPQELQDILEAEIYLLRGEDGNGYEFGLDVDDKGKWSYLLADEEGNELERYNVMTISPEEAGQKAFERVNGSQESEAAEEAPADEVITAPEAEEEVVADADRVELDPADVVVDTETVPEPTPMPVVEDTTAPEEQTPVETPEVETPAVSEEGTAPAAPESAPVSGIVAKAGNYPDGTQIKDSRTSEVIQKTNGKWHVAGKPAKAASPDTMRTPVVTEMPKQPAESFVPFEGIDTVASGDIIVTKDGSQASVIGTREGRLVVMPHNLPDAKKAMRPNTVFADPKAVTGINKFDTPAASAPAPEPSKPRESAYSGNRGRADLTIMDGNGYETKIGDTVMTAVGQGEVVSVRPSSGPQGSVQVRLANGDVKMFRSNKFTNAAGAESLVGDDPATMEVGAQGTGADGRKFLVGKGNKPIHKGDRVELADGRVGTVSGIYAGVKSANIKMEDGSTLRKKVSTLDALDYGMDTPETLETKNGVGLTGKVNLSNAINAARNKVALLNLTSAEKKEFEENMMKKAAELGSIKDDGSERKGSEELFEKWVFDAIAELERKNDPLVAAGTPEAPSPLFFTVDDKGNVLELIKDEDDSLSIRLDGEWVDISDEDEFPTVYEQILKPATDDSVGAWDADLEDNQELKLEDIADYIVE